MMISCPNILPSWPKLVSYIVLMSSVIALLLPDVSDGDNQGIPLTHLKCIRKKIASSPRKST